MDNPFSNRQNRKGAFSLINEKTEYTIATSKNGKLTVKAEGKPTYEGKLLAGRRLLWPLSCML
jgi:hypothetical protein